MAYVVSPCYVVEEPQSRSCAPGALVLAAAIASRFPSLLVLESAYGCYNRRRIAGSSQWSQHADGSALDVGIGSDPTDDQLDQLAQLTWKLTAGCYELGIQRQICRHFQWTADRGWRKLSPGADQHLDHSHVELCRAAAWSHPLRREVADCALS